MDKHIISSEEVELAVLVADTLHEIRGGGWARNVFDARKKSEKAILNLLEGIGFGVVAEEYRKVKDTYSHPHWEDKQAKEYKYFILKLVDKENERYEYVDAGFVLAESQHDARDLIEEYWKEGREFMPDGEYISIQERKSIDAVISLSERGILEALSGKIDYKNLEGKYETN